ncbi:carbohydrate ABC transporter permease [Alicyclobacillus fodiniaquatilis]|jgi:ABC-type sugar transport system permease subunit|uniref:Carbohydrate ABC transporter permease n=1 Tax=Alicyclobacillus fodiniaquatilis TaxID=1661150 RepID=A0ABW4JHL4_9BACL
MSTRIGGKVVPYLFIAPFIISFIVFFLYPGINSLVLSLYNYPGYGHAVWVGLHNYSAALTDPFFWVAFRNTIFYWVAHAVPVIVISFLLALGIHSQLVKWKSVIKPLVFFPQVVPTIAAALVFQFIFSSGIFARSGGGSVLSNPDFARWAVVIFTGWGSIGWFTIVFLAGLTTVSEELYEAAAIDGASSWNRMFRITIPLMRPIFSFAFVMDGISSIQSYTGPNVLLAGSGQAPADAMPLLNLVQSNITGGSFGLASAFGWLTFLIIAIISVLQLILFRGNDQ